MVCAIKALFPDEAAIKAFDQEQLGGKQELRFDVHNFIASPVVHQFHQIRLEGDGALFFGSY